MAKRDRAHAAVVEQRLCVRPGVAASRRVPRVADGVLAAQRGETALVEDLSDEPEVAHGGQSRVLADRDSCRLLAAVLEGVEPEVGEPCDVARRRPQAEDAAHLADRS